MWGFPCCALLWSCWGFVMAAALCSSGARRTPSSCAGLAVAGTVLISSTALPSSDLRSAAMYGNREGACTLLQKRAQSTEGEEQTLARSLQWVGKLSCNAIKSDREGRRSKVSHCAGCLLLKAPRSNVCAENGFVTPTARLKLPCCDCCDSQAASSRDAFRRGSFTKADRSYENGSKMNKAAYSRMNAGRKWSEKDGNSKDL